jgi:hypothetical protein
MFKVVYALIDEIESKTNSKPIVYYALESNIKHQIRLDDKVAVQLYISTYAQKMPGGIKHAFTGNGKLFIDNLEISRSQYVIKKISLFHLFEHARGVKKHGNKYEILLCRNDVKRNDFKPFHILEGKDNVSVDSMPALPLAYKIDDDREYYGSQKDAASFAELMQPPQGFRFIILPVYIYKNVDVPKFVQSEVQRQMDIVL